jgi:hypothetical protein
MAKDRNWIVTTSSDRPIKDIVKDLEAAGLSVAHVNDEIQSITGAAAQEKAGRLRAIKGVVDVSPDEPVDIGPPDSSETW